MSLCVCRREGSRSGSWCDCHVSRFEENCSIIWNSIAPVQISEIASFPHSNFFDVSFSSLLCDTQHRALPSNRIRDEQRCLYAFEIERIHLSTGTAANIARNCSDKKQAIRGHCFLPVEKFRFGFISIQNVARCEESNA